jgi:hypothetical protein
MRSKTTDADLLQPYPAISRNQEMPDGIRKTFKPNIIQRINTKMANILSYTTQIGRKFSSFFPNETEQEINQLLKCDLRNHNYMISQKKLIPSFKLHERLSLITTCYPEPLESFIDIGCYRGFFALDAANRPGCNVSVGIDVYEPFIHTSNTVREYLSLNNSSFYMASLDMVSSNPAAYGGPFQTVQLINVYHYLFWGSSLCSDAYLSHHEILRRLSRICTDRLIFSARLEVDRLPGIEKEKVKASGKIAQYNTGNFLRVAREFFEVHMAGFLGRYPLFIMEKKN